MIKHIFYKLPDLKNDQSWCCANGCGDCQQVDATHERMVETDKVTGEILNQIIEHHKVSQCCKADLLIWDEQKEQFIMYLESPTYE